MSKTYRNFSKPAAKSAPRPQPKDKSCGAEFKRVAQNYRRELASEPSWQNR